MYLIEPSITEFHNLQNVPLIRKSVRALMKHTILSNYSLHLPSEIFINHTVNKISSDMIIITLTISIFSLFFFLIRNFNAGIAKLQAWNRNQLRRLKYKPIVTQNCLNNEPNCIGECFVKENSKTILDLYSSSKIIRALAIILVIFLWFDCQFLSSHSYFK